MRSTTMALAVAALAAVACGAPAAIAATGTFELHRLPGSTLPQQTIPNVTGPLVAGDAVVLGVGGSDGAATIRLVAPATGGARDVAVLAPKQSASLFLHASPTRLVAIRNASVCTDCKYMNYRGTLDAVLAGPLGGPLTAITQCEEGQPCAATYFCSPGRPRFGAALGGDLLVVRDECDRTASVTNLAGGAPVQLGPAEIVAVAGPYVALGRPRTATAPAAIAVVDAASGAEIYRTTVPDAITFSVTSLAMAPDATVVYSANARNGVAVVVASPATPAGRVLRTAKPYGAGVIGVGPVGALLREAPSRLELVPLDGGAGRGVDVPDASGATAFDGRTIAWARRTCVTTAITSWTLGDRAPAALDLHCPTALASRSAVTMSRAGIVRVGLACPASPRGGCLTTMRLTAIRRGRLPRAVNGAERSYRLGIVSSALDPGERTRVELRLPAGAARWVRRHAPLRLRLDVRSERTEQLAPGDSGVALRTVALRAVG